MADWNGDPTTLTMNESVNMPQTNDGSMVLGYQNMSTGNDDGTLVIASGGAQPEKVTVQAGQNQLSIKTHNWEGNNLQLTNQSVVDTVTIRVQAIGPGHGTTTPKTLPMDGTAIELSPRDVAQGNALPQWMTLRMKANTSQQTIFVLIGGPGSSYGLNAYTFGLNMPQSSGPQPGAVADGYYQETTANSIDFQFNWGSDRVWIANFSGDTASAASVAVLPG